MLALTRGAGRPWAKGGLSVVRILLVIVLGLAVIVGAPAARAQTAEELKSLRQSIDVLRESQQRIERDLQEIKTLLRGRAAAAPPDDEPKNLTVSIDGDPVKGASSARLVLLDFTDYQ
jgi:hypothetical protein